MDYEEGANISYDSQCILYASATVGYIHNQCVSVPEIRWNGFSGGGERILIMCHAERERAPQGGSVPGKQ